MGEQGKKCQDVVFNENPNEDQDNVPISFSTPGPALSPSVSLFVSCSSLASFLLVFPSASRSSLAFSLPVSPSASRSGPASFLPDSPSTSRSSPALPFFFSLLASHFGPTSFPSHSGSPSSVSPTFTKRTFSPVISCNSLVYRQSVSQTRRCFSLPRENEDDLFDLVRVPKKRLQKDVKETNQKRLRFQPMVMTREEETV